jgi:hypothetical protein
MFNATRALVPNRTLFSFNAHSITYAIVVRNNVSSCGDVCLDAEGSNNVTFVENTAANSANGVLAIFFNSQVRIL